MRLALVLLLLCAPAVAESADPLRLSPDELGVGPKPLKPLQVLRHKAKLRRTRRGDPVRVGLLLDLAQHAQARGRRDEAAGLYQQLLDEPGDARRVVLDAACFQLARLTMGKNPAAARALLLRLVKELPTSPYIPFVYLLFGEHYLDKGEHDSAERFFEKVAAYPESPAAAYAGYLRGWCQAGQGKHQQALASFLRCLQPMGRRAVLAAKPGRKLRAAARSAMVQSYVPVGRPDRARPFFERVDREAARAMLGELAEIYDRAGRAAAAKRVRADAQSLTP